MGGRVHAVSLSYVLGTPLGHSRREQHIQHHSNRGNHSKDWRIVNQQQANHHQQFQQRWQNVEHQKAQQKADALHTAFNVTLQGTGLTVQMKRQIQAVQMAKHFQGGASHRPLGDSSEHQIPDFTKQHRHQTRQPVRQQQPQRKPQPGVATEAIGHLVKLVHLMLHQERHADTGHFGAHQANHCNHNPAAILQQIGCQCFQPLPALSNGWFRVISPSAERFHVSCNLCFRRRLFNPTYTPCQSLKQGCTL